MLKQVLTLAILVFGIVLIPCRAEETAGEPVSRFATLVTRFENLPKTNL